MAPRFGAKSRCNKRPSLSMWTRFALVLIGTTLLTNAAQAQLAIPDRRTFAVSVVDAHHKPLWGLTTANFRGEFQGRPVRIVSSSRDAAPRRIALILDTSGSVMEEGQLQLSWAVAVHVVKKFTPNSSVAIFTVADKLLRHSDFLQDRTQVRQILSHVQASSKVGKGRTALLDGIIGAIREFDPPGFADVVYLITDAGENASRTDLRTAEFELAKAGVRLFLVRLRPSRMYHLPTPEEFSNGLPQQLLTASGGLMLELNPLVSYKPGQLSDKLLVFNEYISEVYRLEVEFAGATDRPREWKLEVVDSNGRRVKEVEVVYPRLLVPQAGHPFVH